MSAATGAFARDDGSGRDYDGVLSESKGTNTPQDSSRSQSEKAADEAGDTTAIATPDAEQNASPRNYSMWQWASILVAIYSSQFLYGLDVTIVADIQGAVTDDFGEVGLLGWLGIGFPLGSVATILSFGKAYSTFDIKWLYIGSMIMFTAGSALCGGAPDMKSLIIGRVWAGAGGAGMYLGVLNLIAANTNIRERPVYVAVSGVVWGAGCILGPIIGGSFADSSATWRWAFYLNLVLFGLFSPILFFVLRPFSFQPHVPFAVKLRTMDWIGITLNAAMWTVFVMLFTFAGSQWAWNDHRTIVLFVMLGVILLAFIGTQYFTVLTTKETRIFPGEFLRNKTLILLYICQACAATTLFIPIYYIPLFFQFVHGDTGVEAAVRLLPFICIGVSANMFQGAMMPKFGRYMPWFFAASMFAVISGALFYATVDVDTPASRIYGYSVLLALGAGLSQMAAYSVAPTEVPPHRVPDAVGYINMAQIGSSVIALTIGSSVFQNVGFRHIAAALSGLGFSDAQMKSALSGRRSAIFTQVSEEARQRLVKAILMTINEEYILVITAGAVGLVVSLLMNKGKLHMEMAAGG